MSTNISPLAGQPAQAAERVDVAKLVAAYYSLRPDPAVPAQRVSFGTSGHRGTSFDKSFNEAHVLAITQAICLYRQGQGIDGPLFIGIDTHALSVPAFESALEVLAANGVETLIAKGGAFTPTPAVSHAILVYNRGRETGLADGIVVTPSHNPPDNGGFKYNPSNGGPADTDATGWIEARANAMLEGGLKEVRRIPFDRARRAATTREHDFLGAYVSDLGSVIDLDVIRSSGIRMGVDPMGGAGVHYWARIAEVYKLDLTVVSEEVDPTFGFMTLDWDGRIRMDPSSAYAMRRLIGLKDSYDIAFRLRHRSRSPRHRDSKRGLDAVESLSGGGDRLLVSEPRPLEPGGGSRQDRGQQRDDRPRDGKIGSQTLRGSGRLQMVRRRTARGLAGFRRRGKRRCVFLRIDGTAWTTDKDGIVPALLAAEMTARSGRDPAELYRDLTRDLGAPAADRVEAPATREQKQVLAKLSPQQIKITELAGEPIDKVLDRAPGNDAPIGGIKVIAASGWFAARPSGTEDIYKIYAESFRGVDHLRILVREAQDIVDRALQEH